MGFPDAHIGILGPEDNFLLMVTFDPHGIDKLDVTAAAGIHRALDNIHTFRLFHPGPAQGKLYGCRFALLKRDTDRGYQNGHLLFLPFFTQKELPRLGFSAG